MNIALLALGSQGDVQPYLALGRALQAAGHRVRLLTHDNFAAAVKAQGLTFWSMPGDVQAATQSPELRALLERGNFLAITRHTARLVREATLTWARAGLAGGQGMDLLVAGMGGLFLGRALSENLRVPLVEAYLVPFTPTRSFPAPLFPAGWARLGGWANRASYPLMRQALWQGFRAADCAARREVLDLPAAPLFGPRALVKWPAPPVLYGISPSVLPRPTDWNDRIHLTGYWSLDLEPGWQPPAALSAFLEAGPPPVAVGFGSMGLRDPQATAALVQDALAQSGQRAVLLSGWGGLESGARPDSVFSSGPLPHSWLFPRMAAVVHHGGAGTTAAGLRAGVPGVVVPFFGDQPFWGRQVEHLGVGPAPLPQRRLSVGALAAALRWVTGDPAVRERAAALGAAIRHERGGERAADLIGAYGRRLGLS